MTYGSAWTETAQVLVALALLGCALWCLPLATWRSLRAVDRASRRWILAAVVAAAAVRWLIAPLELAMIFIGYKQTEHALQVLPISHYGVGASAFYHALFAALPVSHRTMMAVNAVVGVATLPLVAGWAARLARRPRAGAFAAWLVALIPLFVRLDCSEANHVPALWWLLGGLVLLQGWAEEGRRRELLAAVPLLALAAIARPEMPALVVAFGAVTLIAARPPWRRVRQPVAGAAALAWLALCLPHLWHVAHVVAWMEGGRGLPGMQQSMPAWSFAQHLGYALLREDVALRPGLFPAGITALALLSPLIAGRGRRVIAAALLVAAALVLLVYVVDLDEANLARVQVPGALLVTVAAALSLAAARRPRWLGAALAIAALATAAPSVERLWAPTNEEAEEALIAEALDALPAGDEPFTLVRLSDADRRTGARDLTHYYFPDYLVRPPARAGLLRGVGDFLAAPETASPTWYLQSYRCYARYRLPEVPAPAGADEHPRCRAMRERFDLEPVFEREATNHGDVWIEYYGDAPRLRVGLYRVRGR